MVRRKKSRKKYGGTWERYKQGWGDTKQGAKKVGEVAKNFKLRFDQGMYDVGQAYKQQQQVNQYASPHGGRRTRRRRRRRRTKRRRRRVRRGSGGPEAHPETKKAKERDKKNLADEVAELVDFDDWMKADAAKGAAAAVRVAEPAPGRVARRAKHAPIAAAIDEEAAKACEAKLREARSALCKAEAKNPANRGNKN